VGNINSANPIFKNIAGQWRDAHKFSPAPRHRRRIIFRILERLVFTSCLDVGCAQGYLLEVLAKKGKSVFGCDISDEVISANRMHFPWAEFAEVDVSKETYPSQKKFDVVIASELLEHIGDWQSAVKNLATMSKKYILVTVPTGKRYPIDRMVGHFRHYTLKGLKDELKHNRFKIIFHRYWGMPLHALYKYLINLFYYEKIYATFALKKYGIKEKLISLFLYYLFYLNDLFNAGSQLFILAEKDSQ
jgi:SAM-dependent methyltransferase